MENNNDEYIFPYRIKLKDIKGSFVLLSNYVVDTDYDENFDLYLSTTFTGNYMNEELGLHMILIENRMFDEPIHPITYVVNFLDKLVYSRLTYEIEKDSKVKVIISHEYGETSRIIILKDRFGEGTIISEDLMESLIEQADMDEYKWHIINGGKVLRLDNWGVIQNEKYK